MSAPRRPDSTLPSQRVPILVVVAAGARLLATCEELSRQLDEPPTVKVADVATAATTLAEWKPFAVVIPEPVYAFDPVEFDSLARAVAAQLLVVSPDESAATIESKLGPTLRSALSWWQAQGMVAP